MSAALAARLLAGLGAPWIFVSAVSQGWLSTESMVAQGATVAEGIWRYLGYFTVLTNAFVIMVLTRAALRPHDRSGLNAPRVELMTATSILFVGAVYNVLLAAQWDPQGLQKYNDDVLHMGAPILFSAYWLLRPRGGLKWRDALFAAVWPLTYSAYSLARGAIDGFYPYYFMDPSAAHWLAVARNMAALVALFIAAALVLSEIDRRLWRAKPQN